MMHTPISDLPFLPELALPRDQQLRAQVIALFRERHPTGPSALQALSPRTWNKLLHWLDTSGLALYLLDRLRERNMLAVLPSPVLLRLEQNLRDNTARTEALIVECCAIQREFAEAGVSFALLKGFSLWPHSVPRLELRSQLDLDFLVAAGDEHRAQHILEMRGYQLRGVSGRSREFKTPFAGSRTLSDLYKPSPQLTVEVHLEALETGLLARCERHTLGEASIPVLPAPDLFLGQALHLFKHLSRDQMRSSHMLELYRHLLARGDEPIFWSLVKERCAFAPGKLLGLGIALEFVAHHMDPSCVPASVRRWVIDPLPIAARLWIRRYGPTVMTSSFPGPKLHLLLQEAIAPAVEPVRQAVRRSLLPHNLPPPIAVPTADETRLQALARHIRQLRFILFRLRFHVGQGLRYLRERRRWRHLLQHAAVPRQRLPVRHSATASSKPASIATKP